LLGEPGEGTAVPINVYTGLMRSGKSYEVVSEVIVPAIRSGRRVVTNVDGISEEKIHDYLRSLHATDDDLLFGKVIHVENAQVFDEQFFPYYDDAKGVHTDTTVQPGDLVCIDEAWRFWGASGSKIHKNHKSFFLEHGHFTDEKTKVACDLVLMIQDMSTLNRFVKNVVAFNFRTHKKVALGMGNTYSLNMWEGHKQSNATLIGNWVRRYKKEVFPLYSSFKGGAQGVMVNADRRQNIFTNKKLWFLVVVLAAGGWLAATNIWKFFHPAPIGKDGKPLSSTVAGVNSSSARPSALPTGAGTVRPSSGIAVIVPVSDDWRLAGTYSTNGENWVVLTNAAGAIRVASPSQFQNFGIAQIGEVDGARVSQWSGPSRASSGSSTVSPAVSAGAPVFLKK
jgi:zona occludens toxin